MKIRDKSGTACYRIPSWYHALKLTHPAHTEATSRLFNDVYFFHRKMIFKMFIDRLYIHLDFRISESISFQEAVEIDFSYPRSLLKGSVSASGTGQIRIESPRPAVPDTEPILTGMAPCPALYFSYQFLGCK